MDIILNEQEVSLISEALLRGTTLNADSIFIYKITVEQKGNQSTGNYFLKSVIPGHGEAITHKHLGDMDFEQTLITHICKLKVLAGEQIADG